MMWNTVIITVVSILLLGMLTLASYVERVYAEMGKFLSRDFQDNIETYESLLEPKLGGAAGRAQLSMAVIAQLATAALALLVGFVTFSDGKWDAMEILSAAVLIVLIVVVFNRLIPFVFFTRTRGAWLLPLVPLLKMMIYAVLPITVVLGFCLQIAALAEESEPEAPESQSDAVDALIEAGEEEGILEEGDRELIQSVVEFRDKTVREVMTPRPEVFAVPIKTTIATFTEQLQKKPYSRVPVYQESIDDVRGLVYAHDLLQVTDADAQTKTVATLLKPVLFVPESKPVQSLLKEMQRDKVHMAIVIDEYGAVAGVVTIEDMLEEIVGEIRDEHEAQVDVVREADGTYIMPGNTDIDRLHELFGVRPEEHEATTVAGLVSEIAGRIPKPGEVIEDQGLRFEVVQSTDRRIEKLRVRASDKPSNEQETREMRA